jgi:hypothetical protein
MAGVPHEIPETAGMLHGDMLEDQDFHEVRPVFKLNPNPPIQAMAANMTSSNLIARLIERRRFDHVNSR